MRVVRSSAAVDDGLVEKEQGDERREDDGEDDGAHHEAHVAHLVCCPAFIHCKVIHKLVGASEVVATG